MTFILEDLAFAQVDALTDRKSQDTRFGLALAKQLVQLCGGKIWVEIEYRKGADSRLRFHWQNGVSHILE